MKIHVTLAVCFGAVLVICGCANGANTVILATTTSIANSGLLERVIPAYDDHPVRVLQVGSGRALAMLADGQADVAISHAPEQEAIALRTHPHWWYRKVLYNEFLLVGPPDDPARISGLQDVSTAMRRLVETNQIFISRGDESGTHERERQLWKTAGVTPSTHRVVVAGAAMGQTLRIASAMKAYTLTDQGTFDALVRSLSLKILVRGDFRLLNTYAVTADPANKSGIRFARWFAEGDGRRTLSAVLAIGDVRGFSVWPATSIGTSPDARPF